MKKIVVILICLMMLSSCAKPELTQTFSEKHGYNGTYSVYYASYDNVWSAIISSLSSHNVSMSRVDKDSGLLSGYINLPPDNNTSVKCRHNFLYCGDIDITNDTGWVKFFDRGASYNIIVSRIDNYRTKVMINVFGGTKVKTQYIGPDLEYWYSTFTIKCKTTGVFEATASLEISEFLGFPHVEHY